MTYNRSTNHDRENIMRFFPQLPPRQLYKTLYQMTIEELEGLNRRYEPEFLQLALRQAQEERNIANYHEQMATLHSQQEIQHLPELDNQITPFTLAIRTSEKNLETIQKEVTALANELRKVNNMLDQKRREVHSINQKTLPTTRLPQRI
ncbi:hypothetical protein [Legionella tunisiensis]|uniref:hypothetical protein n=1 Tax=Legionella tunisiensis TaxID=1034944 RepID=UPI00036112CC|nr:hypothetical protein [Legionella tunisiensis]